MDTVVRQVTIEGGVLVGHDGSASADEGVRWAAGLAAELGEPLHVLRAWALLNAPEPPSKVGGFIPPLEDWEAAVRDDLSADVARLGSTASCTCTSPTSSRRPRSSRPPRGPGCWSSRAAVPVASPGSASAPPPTRWSGTRRARSSWSQ